MPSFFASLSALFNFIYFFPFAFTADCDVHKISHCNSQTKHQIYVTCQQNGMFAIHFLKNQNNDKL